MDVALEDVNLLLSDLELGVRPQAEGTTAVAKSSSLVVEQVGILEQALLARQQDQAARAEGIRSDAGIVDVAIARGMPRPAGGIDDPTARCVRSPHAHKLHDKHTLPLCASTWVDLV